MNATRSLRVRILGGGVAGLSSALAIRRRAKIDDVVVFEREARASVLGERVGHGLLLMQNGVKALAALGVDGFLRDHTPLARASFQDSRGALIRSETLRDVYCVTRAAIVKALLAALPDGSVEFDHPVESVDLAAGVSFGSGRRLDAAQYDVLVGAEGWRSPLARVLNPTLDRPRSRVLEIVTSSEIPELAARIGGSFVKTMFSERGLAFGLLAPTPTKVLGFLQFDSERYAPPPNGARPEEFRAFLLRVLEGAPAPIPAYLERADFSTAHLWLPVNADVPETLSASGAVLIGDAAHALLPFTSQGVGAALEDAVVLADVLGATASRDATAIAGALAGFAADRSRDVRTFVDGGRRILASFLDTSSGFVSPYVDGAASKLEEHLSLARGGIRALFRVLDLNGSGCLDRAEFAQALNLFELALEPGDANALFDEIDVDDDGRLTVEELIVALGGQGAGSELLGRVRAKLTPRQAQLYTLRGRCRAWFRLLDEDGDGAIDVGELDRGLFMLGIAPPPGDLFRRIDRDGDGKLSFDEFVDFASRTSNESGDGEDDLFSDRAVDRTVLRARAYNYRWAEQPPDVIPLTAADPDFPVAREILEAIRSYTASGYLSYGPSEGLPELRATAAEVLAARRGVPCAPETVFVTNSAASGLYLVAQFAIAEPGDEAVIFDPVDFLFQRSVEAAGGVVKRLALSRERGHTFDPDELRSLISPRTRLLSICSPHNPTGRVWTRSELSALATVALEHDLWILSDEVWSDIVYTPHTHVSTASLAPEIAARTFTVLGFSKSYGLAGLRLGLLVSPTPELHRAIVAVSQASSTAYGVSTLSQIAGIAAYRSAGGWLSRFVAHLARQRDYVVDRLGRIDGVQCHRPEGTYVAFADVSRITTDAESLARELLDRHRVAVVPGSPAFFGPGARGHLRLSFATSQEIVAEGLDRVEAGLTAHARRSRP